MSSRYYRTEGCVFMKFTFNTDRFCEPYLNEGFCCDRLYGCKMVFVTRCFLLSASLIEYCWHKRSRLSQEFVVAHVDVHGIDYKYDENLWVYCAAAVEKSQTSMARINTWACFVFWNAACNCFSFCYLFLYNYSSAAVDNEVWCAIDVFRVCCGNLMKEVSICI